MKDIYSFFNICFNDRLVTSKIGNGNEFSSAEITVVTLGFGPEIVEVTLDTTPAGLSYSVNGRTYAGRSIHHWPVGSVPELQMGPAVSISEGSRYAPGGWSGSRSATLRPRISPATT